MFFARAYKLNQQIMSLRHMQRIAFVAIENVAVFMVLYYFTYHNFFSRLILVYIFLLTFLFVYFWHRIFRWILQKSSEKEIGVYRTLIIGANRPAEEIIKMLLSTKSHIKPVAIIDAYGSGKSIIAGVPVVGKMNMFEKAIAQHDIDNILQADHLEQSLNIINYALQNNIKYMMPPELLGIFQGEQHIEEIEGRPFLKVLRKKHWWDKIW
jgi:FlaA1/EpsC-like NDP-sugar epimerase